MISHADGASSPVGHGSFLSLLEKIPALAIFDQAVVLDELASHEAHYRFDPEVGAEMAREKLVQIAGRMRICSALVRICRATIPADGVIHLAKHQALAEIRSALGVTARPVVFGADGASTHIAAAAPH